MNNSQIIRVNVFASSDLDDVKGFIYDDILRLNRIYRKFGIEFALPDLSSDNDDEEITIILYWCEFGSLSKQEFDSIHKSNINGGKPNHIYVFFREPSDDIKSELLNFKNQFRDTYQHYHDVFTSPSDVCLNLFHQWGELYLKGTGAHIQTTVKNGYVFYCNEPIANIEDLSFIKGNKNRNQLVSMIRLSEGLIQKLGKDLSESQNKEIINKRIEEETSILENYKEELRRYDESLVSQALLYLRKSANFVDGRVFKAQQFVKNGNIAQANYILDLSKMIEKDKQDAGIFSKVTPPFKDDNQKILFDSVRKIRMKNAYAFYEKAKIVANALYMLPNERNWETCQSYQYALKISEEISLDDIFLSEILYDYAKFLSENDINEALKIQFKLLNIYSKLFPDNPSLFGEKYAYTLFNVAFEFDCMDNDQSSKYYFDSINVYKKLLSDKIYFSRLHYGQLLILYGKFLYREYDLTKAEEYLLEALKVFDRIEFIERVNYGNRTGRIFEQLGLIYQSKDDFVEAESYYKKALKAFFNYLKNLKDIYEIEDTMDCISSTYRNLANTYSISGLNDLADEMYSKSLSISKEKIKHQYSGEIHNEEDSTTKIIKLNCEEFICWQDTLLLNYAFFASHLTSTGRLNEAKSYLNKCTNILKKVSMEARDDTQILGIINCFWGDLFSKMKNKDKISDAKSYYKKALSIYENSSFSKRYIFEKAQVFRKMADLFCLDTRLYVRADEKYISALSILRSLSDLHPQFKRWVADVLKDMAIFYNRYNKQSLSEEKFNQALFIYDNLLCKSPSNVFYAERLAETLVDFADFYKINNNEKAEQNYKDSLSLYKQIVEVNPQKYLSNIIIILEKIINYYRVNNNIDKSKRIENIYSDFNQLMDNSEKCENLTNSVNNLLDLLNEFME